MCGIAGIVRFDDRPIEADRVQRMLAALRHRGPDGQSVTDHPRCAMAAARLSIIDPWSGDQPMAVHDPQDPNHALNVVFNGEVYNHRPLRQKLERLGNKFNSSHADTEALALGYRQFGDLLPRQLHGMFAFAIWDAAQRKLILCRDRLGVKPLYLWPRDGEVMFASLISGLIAGLPKGERPDINPDALHNYLRLGYPVGDSLIQGIIEVPPASLVTIDAQGQMTTDTYWRPPPISRTSTALGAVDALREVMTESINTRLEADVELGAFLSGGVDSGLVAALAQRRLRELDAGPLQTFSVVMPKIGYDTTDAAHQIAKHLGSRHTVLEADPTADPIADLTQLIRVAGEPLADPALLTSHHLYAAARQHIRVGLTGTGGDELFGGYDRYRAMRLLQRHAPWLRGVPLAMFPQRAPEKLSSRLRRLIRAAHAGRHPQDRYAALVRLFGPHETQALGITPLPDAAALPDWPDEYDDAHAAMRWDLLHHLRHRALRRVDHASMSVALEIRCPLLATPVIDLAAHLPSRVLMPGNKPKGLLRALAAEVLPPRIAQRKKHRALAPLADWFRNQLKDTLADHLFADALPALGLEPAFVRALFDEHQSHRRDHTQRLFALLQLALFHDWLQNPQPAAYTRT